MVVCRSGAKVKNPLVGEQVIHDPAQMPKGTYPSFDTIQAVDYFGLDADCRTLRRQRVTADFLCRFVWTFAGPVVRDWREHDVQTALVLRR